MTDRELLEAAAKAAGFANYTIRGDSVFVETGAARGDAGYYWNPLTDNGCGCDWKASMTDLQTVASAALESLRGYRRELQEHQPCDAEVALEAALLQLKNPLYRHVARVLQTTFQHPPSTPTPNH